jgi:hypothetical protein
MSKDRPLNATEQRTMNLTLQELQQVFNMPFHEACAYLVRSIARKLIFEASRRSMFEKTVPTTWYTGMALQKTVSLQKSTNRSGTQ